MYRGRRPRGVYTTADYGPLVSKFERTEFHADQDGALRAPGPTGEGRGEIADAEMDLYAVDEHMRAALKDTGTEAPMAESDRPRDMSTMSGLKLRRYYAAGQQPADHGEMNFSHMGPDPRGTATEPDRRKAREWAERRSGHLERTLRGQDSAIQETGDHRPSEWTEHDRRNKAMGVLSQRKKVFDTARGNLIRGANVPGELAAPRRMVEEQNPYAAGAGLAATGESMMNAVVRPTNATTLLGHGYSPLGTHGGVPDSVFQIASYRDVYTAMVPGAAPSLPTTVHLDADLAATREAANHTAAMVIKDAFSAAAQTTAEGDALDAAREGFSGAAAAALAGRTPHQADMSRPDGDLAMAAAVDAFAGSAAPGLVVASGTPAGANTVDDADLSATAAARLAATEAFARAARSVGQSDDLGKLAGHVGELSRADFTAAVLGEAHAAKGKAARRASAKAVANRSRQGRTQMEFDSARQTADYSSAPALATAHRVSAARKNRAEPLRDQTRQAVQGRSMAAPLVADSERARRSALVEGGSFGLDTAHGNSRAAAVVDARTKGKSNMRAARSALLESGSFNACAEGGRALEPRAGTRQPLSV
jgi:hypothetical protein